MTLEPKRADDLYRPSNIVDDIWEYTRNAKVILADLTGRNPNVLYELGLAHAITKPAILITQDMEDIPFDLRSLRIIVYDKNLHNWGEILKETIIKAIGEILEDPDKAIPTTFMKVRRIPKGERSEEAVAIMRLNREIENLKREIRTNKIPSRRGTSIQPDKADDIIREGMDNNASREDIKLVLKTYGVPEDWADLRIEEISKIRMRSVDTGE